MKFVKDRLSIVVPCYNSEKNITNVVENAEKIFQKQGIKDFEFILVNDCSKDNTISVITELAEKKRNIVVVDLAKNSGQHGALMAGFHYVTGEYVVTCEDDGQTQIDIVGAMLERIKKGYDVIAAKYVKRNQKSLFRKIGTYVATKMTIAMMPRPEGISVPIFFLARRFVIEEMIKYNQAFPYVTGLVLRTTHNIANIEVEQLERESGESGYNFRKLLKLWLNGFTTFSIKPLRLASVLGGISLLVGFAYVLILVVCACIGINMMYGFGALTAVVLIMFGSVLLVLGLMGEYIGRIYMCMNNKPQYIIRSVINKREELD